MTRTRNVAIAALVVSIVALAVSVYGVFDSESSTRRSPCGHVDAGVYNCVGDATPDDAEDLRCYPTGRERGITYWQCR